MEEARADGEPTDIVRIVDERESKDMKIEGSCHCGKISYEAEINPEYVIICHCTDCQTISGAPY